MIKQIIWYLFIVTKHSFKEYLHKLYSSKKLLSNNNILILANLKKKGYFITSINLIENIDTHLMLKSVDKLMLSVQSLPKPFNSFKIQIQDEEMNKYPEIIKWGLDLKILDLVESYIGTEITYRGVVFRKDFSGGQENETRLWHFDDEDVKIIKIIIYLNEITIENGPFELIEKNFKTSKALMPNNILRFTSFDLEKKCILDKHVTCIGKRGTTIIVDTANLLHRGLAGVNDSRSALFFAYNSRDPLNPKYCKPLFNVDRFLLDTPNLHKRQILAISK
jgi:hypothetical protein